LTGSLWWPAGVLIASLVLRGLDAWYYRDDERVLRHLGLRGEGGRAPYYRTFDPVFAVIPFVWSWCDVVAALSFAMRLDHVIGYIALVFVVGTRFRALQETCHTATHYGLCRQRRLQWELSNLLFLYPCFKPDMHHRYISHVRQHHHHANDPDIDPNIHRFARVGFTPGMSDRTFLIMLFHPFTPRGFLETVTLIVTGARRNQTRRNVVLRAAMVMVTLSGFVWAFGWTGLVLGYVVPMLTTYPWYSWLSLLAEHRWFVGCDETNHFARECVLGRPTDYPGLAGWFIKHGVFPATDHYHLVHSLYPHIRWNHMAAIDRVLVERDPRYARYGSVGLFFAGGERPSALSELRTRMTSGSTADLAPWATSLAKD
jgi:fatty acid desaturase